MSVRHLALVYMLAGCGPPLGDVRINEISPANRTGCRDVFGESNDWIELYNASLSVIDLGGYHVFNDATPPELGTIAPEVTIPPRGYLVLWADDKHQGLDHLAFKLSSGRDAIKVTDPDGNVVDECSWASADPDISYARVPDAVGDFERCTAPTCGAVNDGTGCD